MPDQVDTHVFDIDSPQSGEGDVFVGGETIPLDYGETQRVDSCGDQLGEGFQDWGKTEVVDDFEETLVVRDDDDDERGGQSERTELLTDEEGIPDDFGGEVESGVRTKDANLVDPDASTDGEEGCGNDGPGDISSSLQLTGGSCKSNDECSRKGFVAIRVAALRSSGFAAARSMTGMKAGSMETMPSSSSDLIVVDTKKDEIVLDHDADDSFRCVDGYSRDNYLYQEEETKIRSELNIENLASQSPLRCSEAAANLSYISSEEPGVRSQAFALSVVDKFLSVTNVGLSQDINNENTDTVISPPIASVKRAQCFVRKTEKSTAANNQVYDWIDSLEDEGGGQLFSRRKKSFFDRKGSKQRLGSLPSEMNIGADKKSSNKGAKSRTSQKLASLARSKNDPFNEMKEKANIKTMEPLEKHDVHIIDENAYNVGPATQMAAEAMQALCHSSPVNFKQTNLQQSKGRELVGASTKIKKTTRTYLGNLRTRKCNKSQESEGIMTRSKQQCNITKSRTKICNSSRKLSAKFRAAMEDRTVEMSLKMTTKKSNENFKGAISFSNGEYAESIVGEIMNNMVAEEAEKTLVPVTPYKQQPSVDTSQLFTSPVAHRTRYSKAAMLLTLDKTLCNAPCKDISRISLCGHRTVEVADELVSSASVVPNVKKNGCDISLNGTINSGHGVSGLSDVLEMERVHIKETGASIDKDAYRESKRRKMDNIESENRASDCKMDNHSKSVDVIAPTVVKPSIQKKKHRVFIRSFAEILDTVKRKKRSAFLSSNFESDGLPSNVRDKRNVSDIRTRPSLLSDILKPYFANDSHLKAQLSYKSASDVTANTHSVSSVKQVIHHNLETSKEGAQSRLLNEVLNENTKTEGSPNAIGQSGSQSSPAIGKNPFSPVCISQDTSKISSRKSVSRSPFDRELLRLETTCTSPSKLNDVRRRKDMTSFQVCFSNHLSEDVIKQQKKILARLGIQVVPSSSKATHFVADKFVRTRNLLEAMAMGKPVVTPMWLESCGQVSCYIDEKNYIMRDSKKEKEIGFSMPVSLARASQHPLLQGKRVFITRNTKPNQELISSLVKAAGGKPLKRMERSITKEDKLPDDLLILAGEEDLAVCAPLLEKGAVVFSSEILLNGIVVQKLEYERHKLFLNEVKRSG